MSALHYKNLEIAPKNSNPSRVLGDGVRHVDAVVPAERAHDHGAEGGPQREPAERPRQCEGGPVGRPFQAGHLAGVPRVVAGLEDELVAQRQPSAHLVDPEDGTLGAESEDGSCM